MLQIKNLNDHYSNKKRFLTFHSVAENKERKRRKKRLHINSKNCPFFKHEKMSKEKGLVSLEKGERRMYNLKGEREGCILGCRN